MEWCSPFCNWVRLNAQYALLQLRYIISFFLSSSAREHAGSGVTIKKGSLSVDIVWATREKLIDSINEDARSGAWQVQDLVTTGSC